MKINITTNEILIPKKIFSAKVDKEQELDSALPEYCPDIARLIKVDCTPFAENYTIEGEKAVINGKAVYDVLYETDYKNRLRCVSFTQEFNQAVNIPRSNAENPSVFCSVACERINCRLISPRRILIKSALGINFEIEGENAVKAIDVIESDEVFFKKKTIGFEGRCILHTDTSRFEESFPLNQSEKSIGEIVCGNISLQTPQVSVFSGKATISTTASVRVLCEEENNEGHYYISSKSLPLNIDYQNDAIEDYKHISISLEPCNLELGADLDQYGENRIIKTTFGIKMTMKLNEPKAYTVAEDMFEKGYDSIPITEKVSFPQIFSENDSGFSVEAKLPVSEPKANSILDSSSHVFGVESEICEGGIKITGHFSVTLISETSQGIFSSDHSIPFEQFVPMEHPKEDFSVKAEVHPVETITTLHSDGTVSARVIANGKIAIYTETSETFISDINKRVPREKDEDEASLIYFFPQKDESLWDIAKNYRVSPESIKKANPKYFGEGDIPTDTENPILINL